MRRHIGVVLALAVGLLLAACGSKLLRVTQNKDNFPYFDALFPAAMHRLADEAPRMWSQRVACSRSDEDFEVRKQLPRALVTVHGILLEQFSDDPGGSGRKL